MPFHIVLVEKRWSSHPQNVHYARAAVREALRELPCAGDADLIELAVGEACSNAVEHGSPSGELNQFGLRCFVSEETDLVFEIEDEGDEFALTDETLSGPVDLYSEHGRGLFLMNQIMDRVMVLRTTQGLNVRMTKRMSALAAPAEASRFAHSH